MPAEAAVTFRQLAADYCHLIDEASATPIEDFVMRIHTLMAELYSVGARLSDERAGDEEWDRPPHDMDAWQRRFDRLRSYLGDRDTYSHVHPEGAEVTVGSLADDLADVYDDLTDGLELFASGSIEIAEECWAISRDIHWGSHALDALRVLHPWARDIRDDR